MQGISLNFPGLLKSANQSRGGNGGRGCGKACPFLEDSRREHFRAGSLDWKSGGVQKGVGVTNHEGFPSRSYDRLTKLVAPGISVRLRENRDA